MSMILLKGRSLTIKNYFMTESMSLSLEERNSSASMTLGPDAPEISVGDWVKDETEPGKGIVWRVKTVDEAVETQTRTVQLEHVVQSLKDRVLFGEVKPGTITGNSNDKKCTAKQAAAYAIARQSDWKLGDMASNPTNPYSFNGENIYAALEMITSSLADMQWEYDLSAYPFTLHIRKQPASGFAGEILKFLYIFASSNTEDHADRTEQHSQDIRQRPAAARAQRYRSPDRKGRIRFDHGRLRLRQVDASKYIRYPRQLRRG